MLNYDVSLKQIEDFFESKKVDYITDEMLVICNTILQIRNNKFVGFKNINHNDSEATLIRITRKFYHSLNEEERKVFLFNIYYCIKSNNILIKLKLFKDFDKFSSSTINKFTSIDQIEFQLQLIKEEDEEEFKLIPREYICVYYGLNNKEIERIERNISHMFSYKEEFKDYNIPITAINRLYQKGFYCMKQLIPYKGAIKENFGKIRGIGNVAILRIEDAIEKYLNK